MMSRVWLKERNKEKKEHVQDSEHSRQDPEASWHLGACPQRLRDLGFQPTVINNSNSYHMHTCLLSHFSHV